MLDYINVNKFMDMSHFCINLNENYTWNPEILRKNAIIFCHTNNLDILFNNLKFTSNKYILITSGSDLPITSFLFKNKPNCIKRWYAINVNYDHPDLIPIPYGLCPDKGNSKVRNLTWLSNNIERLRSNKKNIDTIYCNWTTQNNITKRSKVIEKLSRNVKYIWDYPNFKSSDGEKFQREMQLIKENKSTYEILDEMLHYYEYCNNMSSYQFIASPPGNGEDCHRTWEALYEGCFPIVIKSIIFKEVHDLPIIQVSDYSEVTYDLLYSYLNRQYNYEKLNFKYWENRIINDFNTL